MFDNKKDWKDMTHQERSDYLHSEHKKSMETRKKIMDEIESKKKEATSGN